MKTNAEKEIRALVSDVKFIPWTKEEEPALIGFISCVLSGRVLVKSIRVYIDGADEWVVWPWWTSNGKLDYYSSVITTDEDKEIFASIFMEAVNKHRGLDRVTTVHTGSTAPMPERTVVRKQEPTPTRTYAKAKSAGTKVRA